MAKKKNRWGWWLGFIILVLVIANFIFYFHYYSPRQLEDEFPPKPSKQPRTLTPPVARVAVVIDDIGYALGPLEELLNLKMPVTYAVIPHLAHSLESARMVLEAGGELILHLPMEPHRFNERFSGTQPGMLKSEMTEEELISQLEKNFIPGIVGVNNHMGSKFTEDRQKMTLTLGWIKHKGLFFLDSMTSSSSVGWELAGKLAIKRARRNIFLDNDNTLPAIEIEWNNMVEVARENGHAVAIGHLRGNTIEALAHLLPELSTHGIQLVPLSALVE